MPGLLKDLIRTAHANPGPVRDALLPIIREARNDLSLKVDLPSYHPSDWKRLLEQPIHRKIKNRAFEVMVLGGVGDVPYLLIRPARGVDDETYLAAMKQEFNDIVRLVVDLHKAKGEPTNNVLTNLMARSRGLAQALRARAKRAAGPKLTPDQIKEVKGEMVRNGVPVRFMVGGGSLNIETGETSARGTNIMHQIVYWNFTKETAKKIAKWLGAKAVFSK